MATQLWAERVPSCGRPADADGDARDEGRQGLQPQERGRASSTHGYPRSWTAAVEGEVATTVVQ